MRARACTYVHAHAHTRAHVRSFEPSCVISTLSMGYTEKCVIGASSESGQSRAVLRVCDDDAPSGGASSEVAIDACQTLEVAASRLALLRDALAGRDNSLNKAVDCRQCLFIIPLADRPPLETFECYACFYFWDIITFSESNTITLEPALNRIA